MFMFLPQLWDDYKNKQISPKIINTQKIFGPIVQEGRSLLKKTEGACPKRITTTHGEYTALQWTTVGGARNLHRKSNCHNSWFTPFSLIKDLYLTGQFEQRASFCVLRRKSCEWCHVIYLKLTILIIVSSFPKLYDG